MPKWDMPGSWHGLEYRLEKVTAIKRRQFVSALVDYVESIKPVWNSTYDPIKTFSKLLCILIKHSLIN